MDAVVINKGETRAGSMFFHRHMIMLSIHHDKPGWKRSVAKENDMQKKYENEWITVRGRKILCEILLKTFGNRARIMLQESRYDSRDGREFIRDAIYSYMTGEEETSYPDDFYREHNFFPPSCRKLPDAIEEMIGTLEKMSEMDLTALLDEALAETAEAMKEKKTAQKREEDLYNIVSKLMKDEPFPDSLQEQVTYILQLQAKKESGAYCITETEWKQERTAAEIWCNILIHSLMKDTLPYALMKSLVQQNFVDESYFSNILHSLGDRRDYEWYEEDFMGANLMDDTIIPIKSVLQEVEPQFMQILHIRRA